jgi:hypothetical protein
VSSSPTEINRVSACAKAHRPPVGPQMSQSQPFPGDQAAWRENDNGGDRAGAADFLNRSQRDAPALQAADRCVGRPPIAASSHSPALREEHRAGLAEGTGNFRSSPKSCRIFIFGQERCGPRPRVPFPPGNRAFPSALAAVADSGLNLRRRFALAYPMHGDRDNYQGRDREHNCRYQRLVDHGHAPGKTARRTLAALPSQWSILRSAETRH